MVRTLNQGLAALGLAKHPGKTFIGRIAKGFSWLGYQIGPDEVSISRPTAQRFAARVTRLYEQGADAFRIGDYVRRWWAWVRAGIAVEVGWVRGGLAGGNSGGRHTRMSLRPASVSLSP